MRWKLFIFERFKIHIVPEPLWNDIIKNSENRGHRLIEDKEVTKVLLDLGGLIMTDINDHMNFELPNLELKFRAGEIQMILNSLENLNERLESSNKYYKLHINLHCLCLTPNMRDKLIQDMKLNLPESLALSEIITKEIDRRINIINKRNKGF